MAGSRVFFDKKVLKLYVVLAASIWTLFTALSLSWNIYNQRLQTRELARKEAVATFNKDQAFRFWAAKHGGVYVAVSDLIKPNPYLSHVPDRDITLPSGKRLTLMNPAFVMRQVMSEYYYLYGVRGHITSDNPLNPINTPNEWERQALDRLRQGEAEVFEFTGSGEDPFLLLMRPMSTKSECLKCHAQQGYKEGDLRGGVGVSLPMAPYLASERKIVKNMIFTHLAVWLLGMVGIGYARRKGRSQIAELRRSHEMLNKLSMAVEQSPVSVMITDTQGRIEYVNPGFTKTTGYEAGEVLGKNPDILKADEAHAEEDTTHWETVYSGNVWKGELRNLKKSGEPFWESATIAPVKNEEGVVTHYLSVREDITARRKLEEQLRQGQRMEAVGRLAGGIAHDFNNVLTAIIGYSHILRMQLDTDPRASFVQEILSSAERASNLTRQLLAFSRQQSISPRRVDLNNILKGIEKLLSRLIGEDITLKTSCAAQSLPVMVDPGQIEQVLMNLVTNARDAMPDGGYISVATSLACLEKESADMHSLEAPGAYVVLTVSDTGVGMDDRTRQHIFEPFFTTKETGKGTGLGLSIVYGVVKQHRGSVTVYSEPGTGTTFNIYLPMAGEAEESPEGADSKIPGGSGETILVAEDDVKVRGLIRHALLEYGYNVLDAADGLEAVRIFRENDDKIELLMLDVVMPGMNGPEVMGEARRIRPEVKALFMSGYTADIVLKKGLIDSGQDFLSKPIMPQEMLIKIRAILDRPA